MDPFHSQCRVCDITVSCFWWLVSQKYRRIRLLLIVICMKSHYSKGLSQRVAYCYPTGVTLLHTSSPSPPRARLGTAPRARVGPEAAREEVAGWSLLRCGAWLHQPRGRAQP